MTQRKTTHGILTLLLMSATLHLSAAEPAFQSTPAITPDINHPNFPRAGLCIYVGAGKNPLFTDLARNTSLLIHGLAMDDAALDAARQQISAAGLQGRITVERLPLNPLPYVRDLANLAIVDDLTALRTQGLTLDEVTRVLAPGGKLLIKKDGQWTQTVKPRPPEMDEWTHPWHGADGNLVSSDKTIQFPLGLRFEVGEPFAGLPLAIVSANGRTFTYTKHHIAGSLLTARDAFNGMLLWRTKCNAGGGFGNYLNAAPIVTDGQRVYFYKDNCVAAADAATGKLLASYPVKYLPARLLLLDGVLVAASWEDSVTVGGFASNFKHYFCCWPVRFTKTAIGAVEAFDAATAQRKWSIDVAAQDMVASDHNVYLQIYGSTSNLPPVSTMHRFEALDVQTGRERWTRPHSDFSANLLDFDLRIQEAGQGTLVIARTIGDRAVMILNGDDGTTRWQFKPKDYSMEVGPFPYIWAPIVGNQLWHDVKKYDLKTGAVVGELPETPDWLHMLMCSSINLAGNTLAFGRQSAFFDLTSPVRLKDLDPKAYFEPEKKFRLPAISGMCDLGIIPANGLYYSGGCVRFGQIPGFMAFGSCDTLSTNDFTVARVAEQGPAFGKISVSTNSPVAPDSYPTFRANAGRSACVPAKLASSYKVAWQIQATPIPAGPLAAAWDARHLPILSSPTVANDLVFVAAREANQVLAFHADTGKPAWAFTAGARIDSPPTIDKGLALFGAHDGYLYAVRASDGALAWRTRVAPREGRMVAFEQVESVWPAPGAALVCDGVVYSSAGRETETDGGVALAAFDAATGKQQWRFGIKEQIGKWPRCQNDILRISANGDLAFHQLHFNPASCAFTPMAFPVTNDFSSGYEDQLECTWLRPCNATRSGRQFFGYVPGEIFAWNDRMVYGSYAFGHFCFAISRTKIDELLKTLPKWDTTKPVPEKFKFKNVLSLQDIESDDLQKFGRISTNAFTWRIFSPPAGAVSVDAFRAKDNLLISSDTYDWPRVSPLPGQITSMILTDSGLLIAGRVFKTVDDTNEKGTNAPAGFCCVLSPETGKIVVDFPMPAVPAYEALAVTKDRIFISCENGQLVCLKPSTP